MDLGLARVRMLIKHLSLIKSLSVSVPWFPVNCPTVSFHNTFYCNYLLITFFPTPNLSSLVKTLHCFIDSARYMVGTEKVIIELSYKMEITFSLPFLYLYTNVIFV